MSNYQHISSNNFQDFNIDDDDDIFIQPDNHTNTNSKKAPSGNMNTGNDALHDVDLSSSSHAHSSLT
ncbi:unnamed protein product [Ambrosiozyma monospora]|uniref:Unnamed protein product n=1 Tax=Ambrosiozyma monospora TaxID=43982 RepID=A0ACB5U4E6_AMBMO|nr:unnamed protein product [Ambrosiozyma monospora]